jgi:hypothetical protein
MAYFTEAVRPAHELAVPTGYVLNTEDIALPPGEYGWAPRFPQRLGVTPVPAPGSHEACFTCPGELAEALLEA